MGEVIDMATYKETALAIEGLNGKMYILHFSTIDRLIEGEITIDQIDNLDQILPAILDNWLSLIDLVET